MIPRRMPSLGVKLVRMGSFQVYVYLYYMYHHGEEKDRYEGGSIRL